MKIKCLILLVAILLTADNVCGQQMVIGVSPEGKCVMSTPGRIYIVGLETTIYFPSFFDVQLKEDNGVLVFSPPGTKNLKSARYGRTCIILKNSEDRIGFLLEVEVIKK